VLHVLQIGTKQHQWLTPAARRSPRHVRNKDRFRRHTATEGLLARPSSSVAANLDRSHSDNAFDSRPVALMKGMKWTLTISTSRVRRRTVGA
jgi:SLT domain-containing protein